MYWPSMYIFKHQTTDLSDYDGADLKIRLGPWVYDMF